jgi:hypothetical protein
MWTGTAGTAAAAGVARGDGRKFIQVCLTCVADRAVGVALARRTSQRPDRGGDVGGQTRDDLSDLLQHASAS